MYCAFLCHASVIIGDGSDFLRRPVDLVRPSSSSWYLYGARRRCGACECRAVFNASADSLPPDQRDSFRQERRQDHLDAYTEFDKFLGDDSPARVDKVPDQDAPPSSSKSNLVDIEQYAEFEQLLGKPGDIRKKPKQNRRFRTINDFMHQSTQQSRPAADHDKDTSQLTENIPAISQRISKMTETEKSQAYEFMAEMFGTKEKSSSAPKKMDPPVETREMPALLPRPVRDKRDDHHFADESLAEKPLQEGMPAEVTELPELLAKPVRMPDAAKPPTIPRPENDPVESEELNPNFSAVEPPALIPRPIRPQDSVPASVENDDVRDQLSAHQSKHSETERQNTPIELAPRPVFSQAAKSGASSVSEKPARNENVESSAERKTSQSNSVLPKRPALWTRTGTGTGTGTGTRLRRKFHTQDVVVLGSPKLLLSTQTRDSFQASLSGIAQKEISDQASASSETDVVPSK